MTLLCKEQLFLINLDYQLLHLQLLRREFTLYINFYNSEYRVDVIAPAMVNTEFFFLFSLFIFFFVCVHEIKYF